MLYVVTNDFDEQVRLVRANTEDEAIAKAKASIAAEELAAAGENQVRSWRSLKETYAELESSDKRHREWCIKNNIPPPPEKEDKYKEYRDFDPEEMREVNLDEYAWDVTQVVNERDEVTVLFEVYR
jgi:hypothetical protein